MKPTLLRQIRNHRIGLIISEAYGCASALFLLIAAPIGAQTHCDVHYRWQKKINATPLDRHADSHISLTDVGLDAATLHGGRDVLVSG
ncbi:MAG: hypothetical protein M3P12_12290 [Gemmatimonadota bacterium]|nr:hypothetical protein [Gemmatimonadota bacterium]